MSAGHWIVPEDVRTQRIDAYLAQNIDKDVSRSQIKRLIDAGRIHVNGREVTAHYTVKAGDRIVIAWDNAPREDHLAENIPLDILYEDEQLLFVNKPAGMVVHPAQGSRRHTLVNALLYHTRHLSQAGGEDRPGIVHRLDKDTSGVMVVAKNNAIHRHLARQFKDHTIERIYLAVVRGIVQHDEGLCEEPVGRAFLNKKKVIIRPTGGKEAATSFRVLKRFSHPATLLEIYPRTGRTHQIRVHMKHIGHPVLGDSFYGLSSHLIGRQALHAASLEVEHPKTGERLAFSSPLPADMQALIAALESAA